MKRLIVISVWLTLCASQAAGVQTNGLTELTSEQSVSVQFTDGQSAEGTLQSFNESGVDLIVNDTVMQFPFEQISSLNVNEPVADDTSSDVQANTKRGKLTFTDGSYAHINAITVQNETANILTAAGLSLDVRASNLSKISWLGDDATESETKQWVELSERNLATSDAIVVSKNGALQLIEGVVGNISDQHLTFSIETRTAEVALKKIKGVIFYRAQREVADPRCQLTLMDDSRLLVRNIGFDGRRFDLTLVGGQSLSVASSFVRRVDFSVVRFVYLSNLIPSTNTWTPLLASPEILKPLKALRVARFDRDFRGQRLTLSRTPESGLKYLAETDAYDKGIAISGGGRIVFALNGQFKRLTGLVGFDPQSHVSAVVRFMIKTDGQTAISEVMRAANTLQPIALELDVLGVRRIAISVEYEDGRLAGDVLHLADLKVSR